MMDQKKFSFVMDVLRGSYDQFMAHMYTTASQYEVNLEHRAFNVLPEKIKVTWTVSGEPSRVSEFCSSVDEFVNLGKTA
jgi:hypothetical protein